MFHVKICGVCRPLDAQLAAELEADAIGLNFFPQSKRFVTVEQACAIVKELPPTVKKVRVFVNATAGDVVATFDAVGLDIVQLHGDEPPDFIPLLDGRPTIRAFRLGTTEANVGLDEVSAYAEECCLLGHPLAAVLVDAFRPGEYGGTGATLDWPPLAVRGGPLADMPLILAGGLTAANVTEAIRLARPFGVDTASGVESSTRAKDPHWMKLFIQAARTALGRVDGGAGT